MGDKSEPVEKVTFTTEGVNCTRPRHYVADDVDRSGTYVPLAAYEKVREECEAVRADWLTEQRWHQEAADKAAHLTDALAAKTAECEGLRAENERLNELLLSFRIPELETMLANCDKGKPTYKDLQQQFGGDDGK